MNKNDIAENLKNVSDNHIKEMLSAVRNAFENDAGLSDAEKVKFQQFDQEGVYYGTDIYSDWTEWRGMLNHEADRRGLEI